MKDAELIGLAALVQASCTEIQAANDIRTGDGVPPAYYGYKDLYGDNSTQRIADELSRRQRIRDIERAFEEASHVCGAMDIKIARCCMLASNHEGSHAVVFEQFGEKVFAEWQR